jgi:hypothetical protein
MLPSRIEMGSMRAYSACYVRCTTEKIECSEPFANFPSTKRSKFDRKFIHLIMILRHKSIRILLLKQRKEH